jgi:hypothetical protein
MFLTLTAIKGNSQETYGPVWINFDLVTDFSRLHDVKYTIVSLIMGEAFHVSETPEEIAILCKAACHEPD